MAMAPWPWLSWGNRDQPDKIWIIEKATAILNNLVCMTTSMTSQLNCTPFWGPSSHAHRSEDLKQNHLGQRAKRQKAADQQGE